MFDAHIHLDFLPHEEQQTWVDTARSVGMTGFAVPGVTPTQWPSARRVAQVFGGIFGIGVHPAYAMDQSLEKQLCALRSPAHQEGVSFIGETGLDPFSPRPPEEQTALFLAHLELARALSLPLVMHVVRRHSEILALLTRHPLPRGGLVHGFVGSLPIAREYIGRGCWLGIGRRSMRSKRTCLAIKNVPLDRLVMESDEPGPQTDLPFVLEEIARLRELPSGHIKETSEKAAHALFRRFDA